MRREVKAQATREAAVHAVQARAHERRPRSRSPFGRRQGGVDTPQEDTPEARSVRGSLKSFRTVTGKSNTLLFISSTNRSVDGAEYQMVHIENIVRSVIVDIIIISSWRVALPHRRSLCSSIYQQAQVAHERWLKVHTHTHKSIAVASAA